MNSNCLDRSEMPGTKDNNLFNATNGFFFEQSSKWNNNMFEAMIKRQNCREI